MQALQVKDAMVSDGLKVPLRAYNSIINAYGEQKQLKKMMDTFFQIRKDGLIPDVVTYSSMIQVRQPIAVLHNNVFNSILGKRAR